MSVFFTKRGAPPSLGKKASDYAVGESVFLPINGTNTEFLVVNQGIPQNSNLYDSSCNGTWLLMKDCYEWRNWHSSNVNDYENSTIHSYLNGTFFNLLGAYAQNAIKQVKVPYRPGSGRSSTCNIGANGLSTKTFLLSGAEVGYTLYDTDYLPNEEGSKLEFFTYGSDGNSGRIAKLNGSAFNWWLRSPFCISIPAGYAYCVNQGGLAAAGGAIDNLFGVRPACVINSDTLFDPNTNIIKG